MLHRDQTFAFFAASLALPQRVKKWLDPARTTRAFGWRAKRSTAAAWSVARLEERGLYDPTPIGFYFAKLWYFEKMYPIIFTVAALGRARRKLGGASS